MKSNHIQNFELVYPNIGPDFIESIEKIMKCVSGGDSSLVGELQSNMTMAVLIPCKMFNWSIQNVESSSKIILSTSEVSDWRGFTS